MQRSGLGVGVGVLVGGGFPPPVPKEGVGVGVEVGTTHNLTAPVVHCSPLQQPVDAQDCPAEAQSVAEAAGGLLHQSGGLSLAQGSSGLRHLFSPPDVPQTRSPQHWLPPLPW